MAEEKYQAEGKAAAPNTAPRIWYGEAMPQTLRSGLRINYKLAGSGPPLVLVHGYTASGFSNWVAHGWVEVLGQHNTLLIPDLRGHGSSQKPYRSAAYSVTAMAQDVLAVMDEEGVHSAPIFGYSMGGMIAMQLLIEHADRFEAGVIGGMGSYFPRGRGRFARERQHAESDAPRRSLGQQARFLASYMARFDPIAIEAAYRGVFRNGRPVEVARLAEIRKPLLVVAGDKDAFFDPARTLAKTVPGARFVSLPNEGHLSAVRSPRFMAEVSGFLRQLQPTRAAG
jgi:pimeloyl-ACP methyl ester carboxylesterase